jgi:prolyl-tRNA synthetase
MGTYGIGSGVRWRRPRAAPRRTESSALALAPSRSRSFQSADESARVRRPLRFAHSAGLDVFYDDRDERPGVKFKDADLLGFPIRVNVGGRALKEGKVEIVTRRDNQVRAVPVAEALSAVQAVRRELAAGQP